MWTAFIIAFVITAAAADLRWRKIPRVLTVPAFIVGLSYHAFRGDLKTALMASLIGFAASTLLFALGAIGGGDVKLVTALGAMLGLQPWSRAMFYSILIAAAVGLVQVALRGRLILTLYNLLDILKGLAHGLRPHPVVNVKNEAMIRSPFGVAAAIGTLLVVVPR